MGAAGSTPQRKTRTVTRRKSCSASCSQHLAAPSFLLRKSPSLPLFQDTFYYTNYRIIYTFLPSPKREISDIRRGPNYAFFKTEFILGNLHVLITHMFPL